MSETKPLNWKQFLQHQTPEWIKISFVSSSMLLFLFGILFGFNPTGNLAGVPTNVPLIIRAASMLIILTTATFIIDMFHTSEPATVLDEGAIMLHVVVSSIPIMIFSGLGIILGFLLQNIHQ